MIKVAVFEGTNTGQCDAMNEFLAKHVKALISVHTAASGTKYTSYHYVTIVYQPHDNDTPHQA